MIAFGSGMLMFLVQSEGFRPSFVNLVFLTIAASTVFRFAEKAKFQVINSATTSFLKKIGCLYLTFTIAVSLYGNYLNWKHWNSILVLVNDAKRIQSEDILEVEPYPFGNDSIINLLSGFHIVVMPFNNGYTDISINNTFARYYNIRGIKQKE